MKVLIILLLINSFINLSFNYSVEDFGDSENAKDLNDPCSSQQSPSITMPNSNCANYCANYPSFCNSHCRSQAYEIQVPVTVKKRIPKIVKKIVAKEERLEKTNSVVEIDIKCPTNWLFNEDKNDVKKCVSNTFNQYSCPPSYKWENDKCIARTVSCPNE
jgi:hypothetical protein